MKSVKSIVAVVLSLTCMTMPVTPAHALAHGFEVASVALGAGSLSYGKAKKINGFKYAGWTLIAAGGTVIAADGSVVVFYAAFLGALVGTISQSPSYSLDPNFRRHQYGIQPSSSTDSGVPLSSMVSEVESDSILATQLTGEEGSDALAISSLSRTLNMSSSELGGSILRAKDLADGLQGSRFGTETKTVTAAQVDALVPAGSNSEQRQAISGLLRNYLRMRNVLVL